MIFKPILLYLFMLLLFLLVLPVKLIQQRYKLLGVLLFSLGFLLCTMFIAFALFPLDFSSEAPAGSGFFLIPFWDGYKTYRLLGENRSILPFVLFYMQYFFYSASFTLCEVVTSKKKSFALPLAVSLIVATLAVLMKFINASLLTDTGVYIAVLAGCLLGRILGRLVYPYSEKYINKYI